jgi:hypothetical protein
MPNSRIFFGKVVESGVSKAIYICALTLHIGDLLSTFPLFHSATYRSLMYTGVIEQVELSYESSPLIHRS